VTIFAHCGIIRQRDARRVAYFWPIVSTIRCNDMLHIATFGRPKCCDEFTRG